MTELLEKAFTEASKLPTEEQERLAEWILEEIASERRWEESFARSADKLAQLAAEARAEHRAGKTRVLDPDNI
jgi:hypothetical protein